MNTFQKSGTVRAICPECESIHEYPNEYEAQEVVENHNNVRHNGKEVAGIAKEDVMMPDEMLKTIKESMTTTEWINFCVIMES